MKIIKPYWKMITAAEWVKLYPEIIEAAGRTCYKSEDKITKDSVKEFIRNIIKRGHESVLEHCSITVRIVCDRGVTHEIVRHRIASYSQESTRYCNYSDDHIQFIQPCWLTTDVVGIYNMSWTGLYGDCGQILPSMTAAESWWFWHCAGAERDYNNLIKNGWSPQQARSVLPNSLKTEIVVTMNLREWRHFFKLRTAKVAHPQMREIACPMLKEFTKLLPTVFDDINVEEKE